jgi:hypothetical protein
LEGAGAAIAGRNKRIPHESFLGDPGKPHGSSSKELFHLATIQGEKPAQRNAGPYITECRGAFLKKVPVVWTG